MGKIDEGHYVPTIIACCESPVGTPLTAKETLLRVQPAQCWSMGTVVRSLAYLVLSMEPRVMIGLSVLARSIVNTGSDRWDWMAVMKEGILLGLTVWNVSSSFYSNATIFSREVLEANVGEGKEHTYSH